VSNAKRCICKGRPLHELMGPFAARMRPSVAAGVDNGQPTNFRRIATTAQLVKALSEGKSWAFQARFDGYDHHLADCPCSPRFQVVDSPAGAGLN